MRNYTVKHGLYKSLPEGTIYNSQAMALIFMCGAIFKITAAPGMFAEYCGSSTLWVCLMLSFFEVVLTTAIFAFARKAGDHFLSAISCRTYRILCAVAAVWMTLKGAFYFSYSATYLMRELFAGLEPSIIYIIFLIPIVYIGIKGIRTIARSCELSFLIFFGIIMLNLVFLKTDLDFGRNLPVFSIPPKDLFATMPRFGLWLGDLLPFVFVRIKNKRMPYIVTGLTVTWVLVDIIIMLGAAIYGESLKTVYNLLINLAGFNQLSLEIGRLDWTNLLCMLAMSIYSLSFTYWGVISACKRAFKNGILGTLLYPLALALTVFAVPSNIMITDFAIGNFGYVMFALAIGLPLVLVITLAVQKKRFPKLYRNFDNEYLPYPQESASTPNSLADGIMVGFKTEAIQTQTVTPSGMLQPDNSEDQQ